MTKSRQVADFGAGGFYAGKNKIINGDFGIWQRGTSFTGSGNSNAYTVDRWRKDDQSVSTLSRQSSGLTGFTYCVRSQRNSGQTTGSAIGLVTALESLDSVPLAGKTITISFWARKGSNYSATNDVLNYRVYTGTGTDQSRTFSAGFTGEATPINTTATLTTSWQRFSASATLSSSTNQIAVQIYYAGTGTAGANDYFEITGVQLELGEVATPFQTASGTLQGELALCQRYYWRYGIAIADTPYVDGRNRSTTSFRALIRHPVTMRGNPTFASSTVSNFAIYEQSSAYTVTSLVSTDLSPTGTGIQASVTSGLTSGYASSLLSSPGITTSYMEFSAEL